MDTGIQARAAEKCMSQISIHSLRAFSYILSSQYWGQRAGIYFSFKVGPGALWIVRSAVRALTQKSWTQCYRVMHLLFDPKNLLVADSPPAEEFGTTTKHRVGMSRVLLKEVALGLNLIGVRLSSYSPESPAQKDIFADTCPFTHVPLPMCLTGSEPGCHVLQRACLW